MTNKNKNSNENKGPPPLTVEEHEELQILEYIAYNTPRGLSEAERASRERLLKKKEGRT